MPKKPTRKLKVFQALFGFFDTVVAAPSQAAALRAWGTHRNLFATGHARVATDEAAIAAALEHPGTLLRRAVGSNNPFALEPTSLPKIPDLPAAMPALKRPAPKTAKPKAEPVRRPPADRSRLDAAQAALAELDDRRKREEADLRWCLAYHGCVRYHIRLARLEEASALPDLCSARRRYGATMRGFMRGGKVISDTPNQSGKYFLVDPPNFSNGIDRFIASSHGRCDLSHEGGHYLHLGHTFAAYCRNATEARDQIRNAVQKGWVSIEAATAIFDGDTSTVSDTPPDPGSDIGTWPFTLHVDFGGGVERDYVLNPLLNVMSYLNKPNLAGYHGYVSGEQIARMRGALESGNRNTLSK